jgi:uncharacterized glyoxalase superfamily protein PhnB
MVGKPFPDVMPMLAVGNVEESLAFYERAFGFRAFSEPLRNQAGVMYHADLAVGSGVIMLGLAGPGPAAVKAPSDSFVECPLSLYVYVDEVDDHFLRAKEAGAEILAPPADMFWGDRAYQAKCPAGYRWMIATHTGKWMAPPA